MKTQLILAINEAAAARPLGIAVNQMPIAPGEWQQISPYGEFPNVKGLQRIDRAAAERMVAAFNSLSARVGRLFRGLPVYVGHPDVDPERYPDKRRYGKITEVEARADGFWGRVSWNDLGTKNQAEGYWVYPSGAWYLEPNADGTHSPVELVSIGLTNDPNIPDVQPWTANEKPAAGDGGTTQDKKNHMPTWLLEMLGLKPEATEEEVKNALKAKLEAATKADTATAAAANEKTRADGLQAQLTAANTAKTTAETAAANERTARAGLLIDQAIGEGRVLPAERPVWVNSFAANFADAETRIKAEAKKLNTKEIDLGGARMSIATANERQEIIRAAVNERTAKGASYEAAYAAVKADPKYKPVFEAMQKPA